MATQVYILLFTNISEHEVRPEEIGLVSTKGEDEKQPFMVAFLKASAGLNERVMSRKKRENRKHKKNHNNYAASDSYRNPFGKTIINFYFRILHVINTFHVIVIA